MRLSITALVLTAVACGDNLPGGPEALRIEPTAFEIPLGTTRPLEVVYDTADGVVAAGPEVQWRSADDAVATIDVSTGAPILQAHRMGAAWITARAGALEASAAVFVTEPIVVGLVLAPEVMSLVSGGACRRVEARATRSDGTEIVLDGTLLSWTGTSRVSVSIDGTVCGAQSGQGVVTGRYGAFTATVTVNVTVAAPDFLSVFIGDQALQAGEATFAEAFLTRVDGSTEVFTDQVAWRSQIPTVATVDPQGVVTGVATGTTFIEARYLELVGEAAVTVLPPPLARVEVSPSTPSVPAGGSIALTATAVLTTGVRVDVTNSVLWATGSPTIARVTPAGSVTGLAPGQAVVTARYQNRTGGAIVTVTPP